MRLTLLNDYIPPVVATLILGFIYVFKIMTAHSAAAEAMIIVMIVLTSVSIILWVLEDALSSSVTAHVLTFSNLCCVLILIQIPISTGWFGSSWMLAHLFQAAFLLNAAYCHYWYYQLFLKKWKGRSLTFLK